ncbi:MAG: hypothetical protein IPI46_14900 [Bacteroidetes bacterium]|nr:hypothetical protein [Bacteroidota bacterium]
MAIPLFLFHHTFIYTGGVDQFTYYWSSNEIIQMWFVKPELAAKVLFSSYTTFNEANVNIEMSKFIFAPNESFVLKLLRLLPC